MQAFRLFCGTSKGLRASNIEGYPLSFTRRWWLICFVLRYELRCSPWWRHLHSLELRCEVHVGTGEVSRYEAPKLIPCSYSQLLKRMVTDIKKQLQILDPHILALSPDKPLWPPTKFPTGCSNVRANRSLMAYHARLLVEILYKTQIGDCGRWWSSTHSLSPR